MPISNAMKRKSSERRGHRGNMGSPGAARPGRGEKLNYLLFTDSDMASDF